MILESKDLNKCYGCFACANVCPKNCIELKQNEEGFFMPEVDRSACINCGLCDKVCIIGKTGKDLIDHKKRPACYYGFLKDDALRKRSASGGLAYALSAECIKNGGVVFGVVGKWFENVHHVKAETLEQLDEICGSKNIQSYVGDMYAEAKKELTAGRQVVFTGTPCQIAALYSYLGKDYANLLTADLVCHGVPSQKVLKSYIAELEKKANKKIVKFGRDETFQYVPVQYIAWYEDESYEILMPETSVYRKGFLSNLFQRKSCANCAFSKLPRIADITMGDVMFAVDKPTNEIDGNNLGVSLAMVNSPKGAAAISEIEPEFQIYPMELDNAIKGNRWTSHGIEKNPLRDAFFETFTGKGFTVAEGIMEKSYENMKKLYIRQGKIDCLKVLINPVKLYKAVRKRIRKRK